MDIETYESTRENEIIIKLNKLDIISIGREKDIRRYIIELISNAIKTSVNLQLHKIHSMVDEHIATTETKKFIEDTIREQINKSVSGAMKSMMGAK